MRKLVYLFLICLLSMMMVGCKSKQKVVETVQYVHDTTFFNKDSVVYRYLTFNGTDEENGHLDEPRKYYRYRVEIPHTHCKE